MDHRTLGIIIVVAGGLILYSTELGAWIASSLLVGLGTSIFLGLHKTKKDKEE